MRFFAVKDSKLREIEKHEFWLTLLLPLSVILTLFCRSKISRIVSGNVFNSIELILLLLLICKKKYSISLLNASKLIISLTFLRANFLNIDVFWALCNSFYVIFGLYWIFKWLVNSFPMSFTVPEAVIVTEAILLFVYSTVLNVYGSFCYKITNSDDIILLLVQMTIVAVSFCCLTISKIPVLQKTVWFLATFLIFFGSIVIIPISVTYYEDVMRWLSTNIELYRYVIIYWLICSILAILVIRRQIYKKKRANTVVRKIFHVLSVMVYIPGIFFCPNLLYFASSLVLAIFLLVETCRVLHIGKLSPYLEDGFQVFVDSKDVGVIALTPIYLLCGLSLPLWLNYPITEPKIYHFSGILSVGIGDTFASYFGNKCGKHRWPNSDRTVEGSLAFFLSQLMSVGVLYFFIDMNLWAVAVSALLGTIIEAKTDQIDNIVLPLIQMLPLQICY